MIRSFASKLAQDIYDGLNSKDARQLSRELHAKARRLLDQLNAAPTVEMLRVPPSNHLEKLSGKLNGFYSIRINSQWRIVFRWEDSEAKEIDIVDYH